MDDGVSWRQGFLNHFLRLKKSEAICGTPVTPYITAFRSPRVVREASRLCPLHRKQENVTPVWAPSFCKVMCTTNLALLFTNTLKRLWLNQPVGKALPYRALPVEI